MLTNRLLELRRARNESLRTVGSAVGLDHGHLWKLEQNQVGCSDAMKVALAAYFGVGVTELFFQSSVESQETATPEEVLA